MQIKRRKTTHVLELAYLIIAFIYAILLPSTSIVFRNYFLVAILTFFCIFSLIHIGFKKDHSFLRMPVVRLIVANTLLFAIIMGLVGSFTGFTKLEYTWTYFRQELLPTFLISAAIEVFHYSLVGENTAGRFRTVISFALTTSIFYLANIPGEITATELIGVVIFTTIWRIFATEAICGYLSTHIGFLPSLLYRLIATILPIALPFWPKFEAPLTLIFAIAFPAITFLVVRHHELYSERHHAKARVFNLGFFTFPIIVILGFFFVLNTGITGFHSLAIASNSMQPVYSRGDMVIYQERDQSDIAVDDILVFRRGSRIITHRVVEIRGTGDDYRFIVKGDNNDAIDDYSVAYNDVYGVVTMVGHYIGYPALIFNHVDETED